MKKEESVSGIFYDAETGFTEVGKYLLIGIALMLAREAFRLILKELDIRLKESKEGV
jgi:hypothetical protein